MLADRTEHPEPSETMPTPGASVRTRARGTPAVPLQLGRLPWALWPSGPWPSAPLPCEEHASFPIVQSIPRRARRRRRLSSPSARVRSRGTPAAPLHWVSQGPRRRNPKRPLLFWLVGAEGSVASRSLGESLPLHFTKGRQKCRGTFTCSNSSADCFLPTASHISFRALVAIGFSHPLAPRPGSGREARISLLSKDE